MLNAEWRKATLNSIQHSTFSIPNSIQEIRSTKATVLPIQT